MFAVGHVALGYLSGKTVSKLIDSEINITLLFFASIVPDADFILGFEHRGPTHSLIVQTIVFIPIFIAYGKRATPVFTSLIQHSLLGDLLTGGGGVQLLWPISSQWYGSQIHVSNALSTDLEWAAFAAFMVALWLTRDIKSLSLHHKYELLLTIPVLTVVLLAFLGFPLEVPAALIIPHLILLAMLAFSVATFLTHILKIRR